MLSEDKRRESRRRWKLKNPEKIRESKRRWATRWIAKSENRIRALDRSKKWKAKNREQVRRAGRTYAAKRRVLYREMVNAKRRTWRANRTPQQRLKDRDYRRKYSRQIFATNINHKIALNLRRRIHKVLRGHSKSSETIHLLGCSIPDFRIYLESKFDSGMTWKNYGRAWHIDHIIPCAIFDLSRPEHQKRCFHFANLQPLRAKDNQLKRDRIATNQFNLL